MRRRLNVFSYNHVRKRGNDCREPDDALIFQCYVMPAAPAPSRPSDGSFRGSAPPSLARRVRDRLWSAASRGGRSAPSKRQTGARAGPAAPASPCATGESGPAAPWIRSVACIREEQVSWAACPRRVWSTRSCVNGIGARAPSPYRPSDLDLIGVLLEPLASGRATGSPACFHDPCDAPFGITPVGNRPLVQPRCPVGHDVPLTPVRGAP